MISAYNVRIKRAHKMRLRKIVVQYLDKVFQFFMRYVNHDHYLKRGTVKYLEFWNYKNVSSFYKVRFRSLMKRPCKVNLPGIGIIIYDVYK